MPSIDEQLDATPAEGWRPKEGDKLIGEVVGVTTRESVYGGTYPVVTVKTKDGERAVHAFHTVLKRELAKLRPRVGEQIGIAFLGKSIKGYANYRIAVERDAAGEPDWDQVARDAESELPDDAPPVDEGSDFDPPPF